jgi:hypothetical protein
VSTVIRISCNSPYFAEAVFEEAPGKLLLNVLGRSYEGYLARGEGAQVIKALTKLSKEDNTGSITFSAKLANYLLRTVTERLAHYAYRMNQVNDKVENQRWGKNGLKLTDDMLAASQGHEEVERLSQLLVVLSLASRHYAEVFVKREDLDGKSDEEDDDLSDENRDSDEDSDDDETDAPEKAPAEMPTTQRRDLMEARKFGRVLVMRALHQPQEKFGKIIELKELMDETEFELWENSQDKAMLVHTVKEIVHMFEKPLEAVSLLVNLTEEERAQIKSPFAYQMFKIEGPQAVWPQQPAGSIEETPPRSDS